MSWLWHFLRAEYWGHPWYQGAVWGNLFVVPLAFVLGVILWPAFRRFVERRAHAFADGKLDELHERFDRLEERLEKKP